jgi:hypothetical protein
MGGINRYGYGDRGIQKAREELSKKKKVILYQKIGITFAVLCFIAAVALIVSR